MAQGFIDELSQSGSGVEQVNSEVQRIASDSDADATPQKNAKDINVLATAVSMLTAGCIEMGKQLAECKMMINKMGGGSMPDDMEMGENENENQDENPPQK